MRSWVTDGPIDVQEVLSAVGAPEDGAVLLFLGTVRNENEGRRVRGMRYEAFTAMAAAQLQRIVAEAAELAGSDRIAAVHRTGELGIGEVSVAVAVSTPHRAQAYEASRYVIEELKRRLPVWKHEHYLEGAAQWLDGAEPPVPR